MPEMTARQAAVQALMRVNHEGGYSNLVLNETLKKAQLSQSDAAFASKLFYGALERRLMLDHIISSYSKKPVAKLTPAVADILRMSLYQLLYLDSVPDSAAVNEAVKLTRQMKAASASGFVNAVLRSFIRDEKKIPTVRGNRLKKLEIQYSCPQWLVKILLDSYGEQQTVSLLEHSLERPPLYARVNTTRTSAQHCIELLQQQGVQVQQEAALSGCLRLNATASIERLQAFEQGLFYVQDKSSQMCAASLEAQPGERILDCCAAPGSKTFTIAQQMQGEGQIISCDIFEEKVKKIQAGAARLGLSCVDARLQDASVYDPQLGEFDRVLCDAPCSGIGIIGRKPEIKYKEEAQLSDLPQLQLKILENVCRYVKVGGRLVYSTCTLLPNENTKVVEQFLQRHSEFEPLILPQRVLQAANSTPTWALTLLPQMAQTDGFFIAGMKRVR